MNQNLMASLLARSVDKIVKAAVEGIHPLDFACSNHPLPEYGELDSPAVVTQMACSETSQILCYLAMDSTALTRLAQHAFAGRSRGEALRQVMAANAEIVNLAASQFGAWLERFEPQLEVIITPPKVVAFSRGEGLPPSPRESACLCFEKTDLGIRFLFLVNAQALGAKGAEGRSARP